MSTENCIPKGWSSRHEQAAEMLASGEKTDQAIAAAIGISERRLYQLKQQPYFAARVEHHLAVQREAVEAEGIANRTNRIRQQNVRWLKMIEVIDARAEDPMWMDVPGSNTGLLVHNVKGVGKGDDFRMVDLFEVDVGLLREMRELEKHTATELGQWEEKQRLSGIVGVQRIAEVEVVMPTDPAP